MKLRSLLFPAILTVAAFAQDAAIYRQVESVYPDAHALYLDLHQSPELSFHETQTAAKLASRLRGLGYEVTEHVGETGIVAILKNGTGPTVMLRTELDALPVEEKTGLPYASKVHAEDTQDGMSASCTPADMIFTCRRSSAPQPSWRIARILGMER